MSTPEFEQRAADRRSIWSTLLGVAARDSTPAAAQWQPIRATERAEALTVRAFTWTLQVGRIAMTLEEAPSR